MNKKNINLKNFFSQFKRKEDISGKDLAEALKLLASREIKPGGPYWDYSKEGKKEVRLDSNKAIFNFLKFFDVSLGPLQKYLISQGEVMENIKFEDNSKVLSKENRALKKILELAEKEFSNLEGDIKGFARQEIDKTLEANIDRQMSLMPYYFKLALGEKGKDIDDKIIFQMGLMNIFFWTAFIIYDDFWDKDEAADPRILPVANFYSRRFNIFFNELFPKDKNFKEFFSDMMNKLDSANTWETTHRRIEITKGSFKIPSKLPNYGDYTKAYQPASAHILGPVSIMKLMGYSEKSREMQNLISYFKNYLITMQLNDDLHDWEEDLERGHLSSAVIKLIKDVKKAYPKLKQINLKKDKKLLKEVFWFKTLPKICREGIKFAKKSRQALKSLRLIEDSTPLERFINLPENALKEALYESKTSSEFFEVYK